jgi:hypothetical protein
VRRKKQKSSDLERADALNQQEKPAEEARGRDSTADRIRLLVLFDGSPASERVLRYVKAVVGTGEHFHIVLLQLLPHFPPELLEHGGSENPATEESLDAELRQRQDEWIANERRGAEQNLHLRAIAELSGAAGQNGAFEMLCCQPEEGSDTAEFVLGVARESGCRTVVVARPTAPDFHESSIEKLGGALLRRHSDLSVWAIG